MLWVWWTLLRTGRTGLTGLGVIGVLEGCRDENGMNMRKLCFFLGGEMVI